MQVDKIFISYSRADLKFALKLAEDLGREGLNIWIDQSGIRPSEPWDREIEQALDSSDCILVVLSHSSVSSGNVLNEINYALEERKRVLPVIISTNIKKPFNIRRLQHVDFTGFYDEGLNQLLKALNLEKQTIVKSSPYYKTALWITLVFVVIIMAVAFIQIRLSKKNMHNPPEVKKKEKEVDEKEYIIAGTVVDGSSNKSIELAEVSIGCLSWCCA